MSLHTLALVCFILAVANEGAALAEESDWTLRKVVLGIPLSILFYWLLATILL